MQRHTDPELRLRRKPKTSAWRSLLYRIALALALIGVTVAVHWYDRDGLRDNVDGHISFLDVLYFTMITITTVGFGDITPITPAARAFDTFVVTPIRIFVWIIFLGTAYDFMFKRLWGQWRMQVIQKTLSGHVVIAGYGDGGEGTMRELLARRVHPERIVIVDTSEPRLAEARECGTVLLGDATRDAVMSAVRIGAAQSLVVAAGRDDTSILIVLTARRMAPDLSISVIIKSQDNEALAHQAGADTVINPSSLGALLLAGSTADAHLADYVGDLLSFGGGAGLAERAVRPEEVGKPLAAITTGLGVRLYRGGQAYCFSESAAQALRMGDTIIEVLPGSAMSGDAKAPT